MAQKENDTAPMVAALTRTCYGSANPERVENALWQRAIEHGLCGYSMRQHCKVCNATGDCPIGYWHSSYRDATPGPFWSWCRFGRTSTTLPDGRIIHVAGEHEDSYDPDFCIYNDVVVEHPDGTREIFLYPADVFPPTDFHSATLIGNAIFLIGSLGYHNLRRIGETQVLKLDCCTLSIETVATTGELPGWISRHVTEQLSDTKLLIIGGQVQSTDKLEQNTTAFELDLTTLVWKVREHGDARVFPVTDEIYRKHKNPSFGATNPDPSGNPFWLEMARRQWSASRARLHFGDLAPPEPQLDMTDVGTEPGAGLPKFGSPESKDLAARIGASIERSKLVRTVDDVVWTAVRQDAVELSLIDQRKLLIGGQTPDYGDEYADPWIYNDVIVTQPDGAMKILTYPTNVFPLIRFPVGIVWAEDVFIFGIIHRTRPREQPRTPVVMRLNTSTYEIVPIPAENPPSRVKIYQELETYVGNHVDFPLVRQTQADPALRVAFDLTTLKWGEPFPSAIRC